MVACTVFYGSLHLVVVYFKCLHVSNVYIVQTVHSSSVYIVCIANDKSMGFQPIDRDPIGDR